MAKPWSRDLNVAICGEAGQGIATLETVLLGVLKQAGYHVCATKEYMSRIRGAFMDTSAGPLHGEALLNGAEAAGLGALAGGCSFIASYPMSPSTGVLTFLSANGAGFDAVAEQAEDEIAAINMALGASYAGARAMVTTRRAVGIAHMTCTAYHHQPYHQPRIMR